VNWVKNEFVERECYNFHSRVTCRLQWWIRGRGGQGNPNPSMLTSGLSMGVIEWLAHINQRSIGRKRSK